MLKEHVKEYLTRELNKSQYKIKKLKRKRRIYKILFITTAGTSITISVILASISSLTLPPVVIPILSITVGVLTGLSAKFRFEDNKEQLSKEISTLDEIQNIIDYLVSCNGNLSKEDLDKILNKFKYTNEMLYYIVMKAFES